MKQQIQNWLSGVRRPEGTLAVGVRLPTNALLTAETEPFPRDRLQLTLQLAAETVELLASQEIGASSLIWRFDEGNFHFTLRPDGAGIGILTQREADPRSAQRLVREFLALG